MRQGPRFLDPLFSNALFIIISRLFILYSFTSVTSGNMQVLEKRKTLPVALISAALPHL